MRVIAGRARGRPLLAPRGTATRPIADRVKETLFAILGERVVDAVVLDLYAGSGAIGIEAISRGAASCDFVEVDRHALAALKENLERTGFTRQAAVHRVAVERFLASAGEDQYDLAFLDPPYASRAILAPLQRAARCLTPAGMAVVKHHWRTEVPAVLGLSRWRERRFGETTLTFLSRAGGEEEP